MALKLITQISTVSGQGWEASKKGGVTTLVLNAPTTPITLPNEFRPNTNIQMVITGLTGQSGRAIINSSTGVVTPFIDGNYYGTVTYLNP
ncbi:hypothetical protein HMPREF3169_09650 [Corynebacterium sp. HMSC08C04]|uniref:hypothetical protein n=1 Tax=Corynebacterium sp. HMSC08C04 TaxID=1581137 RepID=UPI0008A4DD7F|nr:hypothetical protein [Corynebacterium sp. HMSC08C04]OFT32788.1 hypothetical protein HMPREF3169_09650 [Corynebacterium sp. HMSC08C04]